MQDELEMPMMAEAPASASEIEKVSKYRPSNNEVLREYEIRIRFLNRGCVVGVGCKEIAFEDHTNAMAAINAYVANPWEEQQKWRKVLD